MNFYVTKKDIQDGKPKTACLCPIAKAISRRLGGDTSVSQLFIVRYDLPNIATPQELVKFIDNFDSGRPVKPFRFSLPTVGTTEPTTARS